MRDSGPSIIKDKATTESAQPGYIRDLSCSLKGRIPDKVQSRYRPGLTQLKGRKLTGRSFLYSGEKKAKWHKELLAVEYFCTTYKAWGRRWDGSSGAQGCRKWMALCSSQGDWVASPHSTTNSHVPNGEGTSIALVLGWCLNRWVSQNYSNVRESSVRGKIIWDVQPRIQSM